MGFTCVAVAAIALIVAAPSRAVALVERTPAKVFLAALTLSFLLMAGVGFYRLLYYPPARRVMIIGFYTGITLTIGAAGLPILIGAEHVRASLGPGKAWVDIGLGGNHKWLVLVSGIVMSGWFAREYVGIIKREQRTGKPLR